MKSSYFCLFLLSTQLSLATWESFNWPVSGQYYRVQATYKELLQPTNPKNPASGAFGCVREHGKKFHEGIDIKPTHRDRKGEPKHDIHPIYRGVVRHISSIAGNSSYGKYIVLEHPGLDVSIYSLYAHLHSIPNSLNIGDVVTMRDSIGTMGYTASGYTIAKQDAHLHLEIGLAFGNHFEDWYKKRKFTSSNKHSIWNGMNLVGLDPWDFIKSSYERKGPPSITEYIKQLPVAIEVDYPTQEIPWFVEHYPTLLQPYSVKPKKLKGWRIGFTAYGLPTQWKPLYSNVPKQPSIVKSSSEHLKQYSCKKCIENDKLGSTIKRSLELLFK